MTRLALHTPAIAWGKPVNRMCPLNRGLIGWWLCGRPYRGATFYDLNGVNHGTLTNMDPATDWIGPTGRPGGFGALDFDSSNNNSVDVANAIPAGLGTSDYSMGCWVRPVSVSGFAPCVSLFTGTTNTLSAIYQGNSGGNWGYYHNAIRASGRTLTAGNWYHLFIIRRAGVIEFYQDGATTGTTYSTDTASHTAAAIFTIGEEPRFSNDANARIDDVRLYDRAIEAADVQAIYADSLRGYPATLNRVRRPIYGEAGGGGGGGFIPSDPFGMAGFFGG